MVATLKASGVRRVYGLPGDSINGFTDALRRDGEMVWKHVRHEEAAAFAAAGEAAMTGQLAVCAASCGPGNLHLINGLFDANRSRVPVLAIAAHIPREEIGGSYFQETHPQELFRECSVYAELVSVPEQLPRVLEIAMRHAIERSGVAVVVVPGEIFLDRARHDARLAVISPAASVIRPSDDELAAAAQSLNAAERVDDPGRRRLPRRPRRARRSSLARSRRPSSTRCRGKEFVEYDNPYDVGMTGLLGFTSGVPGDGALRRAADARHRLSLSVVLSRARAGRSRSTSAASTSAAGSRSTSGWSDRQGHDRRAAPAGWQTAATRRTWRGCGRHYRRTRERLDALAETHSEHGQIHPQVTAAAVDRARRRRCGVPRRTSGRPRCGRRGTCA